MTRRIVIKRKAPTPAVARPVTVPVFNGSEMVPMTLGIDSSSGPDRTVVRRADGIGLAEGDTILMWGQNEARLPTQVRGVTLVVGECEMDYDMMRRRLLCNFPISVNGTRQVADVALTDELLMELSGPRPEDSLYVIRRLVETSLARTVDALVTPLVMEDVSRRLSEFHRRGRF